MNNDPSLRDALTRCLKKGLTFAAFRRPGMPVTIWAQRDPGMETVDGSLLLEVNDVFLVAPFLLDPERIAMIRSDIDLSFGDLGSDISALFECAGTGPGIGSLTLATRHEDYLESVSLAKQVIANGGLQKVVLSRTTRTALEQEALVPLFLGALEERPFAFVALMNTPLHGTWMGASPERLVLEEEDHVRVDALAGTMATDHAPSDPAEWGEKERAEQQIVTTSVMETFARTKAVNVVVHAAEVTEAGEVAHLRTRVEADLGESTLSEVVLALHPTPAVCGTPTNAARDFIRKHEAHDRGLYTGFWGPWYPDGRTELYVNIRCLHHVSGEAVLYTGAGITAGSDPQREWEETERKARTWLAPIAAIKG